MTAVTDLNMDKNVDLKKTRSSRFSKSLEWIAHALEIKSLSVKADEFHRNLNNRLLAEVYCGKNVINFK